MARINFVELPVKQIEQSKRFFTEAFAFELTDFGPAYSSTLTGDVDLGLQANAAESTAGPLVVIAVEDLPTSYRAVVAAGGTITRGPFSFPGGSRFHFLDPGGNELAAWQMDRVGVTASE
jgi:predicted enzyme related to lactoylglutathione lyase